MPKLLASNIATFGAMAATSEWILSQSVLWDFHVAQEDEQVVVRSPPEAVVRTDARESVALAGGWARSFRWAPLVLETNHCLRKAEGDLEGPRAGHSTTCPIERSCKNLLFGDFDFPKVCF